MINVFIPASPNPMSGYLVILPEQDIQFLGISVQDGLKLVISGGMAIPSAQRGMLPKGAAK